LQAAVKTKTHKHFEDLDSRYFSSAAPSCSHSYSHGDLIQV